MRHLAYRLALALAPLPAELLASALIVAAVALGATGGVAPAATAEPAYPLARGEHGQRVKDAQWLLGGHKPSRFPSVDAFRWKPNGLFGTRTAAAVKRAKYELGYPDHGITAVFGTHLREILLGKRVRPPLYIVRAASRSKQVDLQFSYPVARRGAFCGWPGGGTHSYTAAPHNWQSDNAVDICVAAGTPVLAPEDGKICPPVGYLGPPSSRFGGYRLYVCGDTGRRWYLSHLLYPAKGLAVDNRVHAGQTIGYSGYGAGVAHLHFACTRYTGQRDDCEIRSFALRFVLSKPT